MQYLYIFINPGKDRSGSRLSCSLVFKPVFQKKCFSATPEDANILHLHIEVQVPAHLADMLIKLSCEHEQRYQLRVLVLVLLVGVEGAQLETFTVKMEVRCQYVVLNENYLPER